MSRLLWIGDFSDRAGFFQNEYARITHEVVAKGYLDSFNPSILGRGYLGDGHDLDIRVYAASSEEDVSGANRVQKILKREGTDTVFLCCPFHLIPRYVAAVDGKAKIHAWIPVGGPNVRVDLLKGVDGAVFFTEFGLEQAVESGFGKPCAVIPYGIDTGNFLPLDKASCRDELNVDRDSMIIGCVARNTPRNRLELAMSYLSNLLVHDDDIVFVFLAPPDDGYNTLNLPQLSSYFGIGSENGIIFQAGRGISDDRMRMVLSTFDIQVSTTLGEDWGSVTMKGMACGVPQIVPDWSALGEWAAPAARMVPCSEIEVVSGHMNMVGGVPDRRAFVNAVIDVAGDEFEREEMTERGLDLVRQKRFRWNIIGRQVAKFLEGVENA